MIGLWIELYLLPPFFEKEAICIKKDMKIYESNLIFFHNDFNIISIILDGLIFFFKCPLANRIVRMQASIL